MRWHRGEDVDELTAALLVFAQDHPKDKIEKQELWIAHLYDASGTNALNKGDYTKALENYTNANSIFRVLSERDGDDEVFAGYASTQVSLAFVHGQLGENENAVRSANTALNLLRLPSTVAHAEQFTSMALNVLGSANQKLGLHSEAIDAQVRLVAIKEALAKDAPDDESRLTELADAQTSLGRAYSLNEQWDEAVGAFTQSIDILHGLMAKKVDGRGALSKLLWATSNLGKVLECLDQHDQAIVVFQDLVGRTEAVVEQDPSNHELQEYYAMALGYLGECYLKRKEWHDAAATLSRASNIMLLPAELNPRENRQFFLSLLYELEGALRELGREVEAQEAFAKAEDFAARHPDREDIGDTQE
jgi:tetratricopeptide (TPR) repeat protein